jgi:hypothetical protein
VRRHCVRSWALRLKCSSTLKRSTPSISAGRQLKGRVSGGAGVKTQIRHLSGSAVHACGAHLPYNSAQESGVLLP